MRPAAARYRSSMDSSADGASAAAAERVAIDPSRNRYPFCLVWGPLPLISWFLPFIGHMGICDSKGRVHDFAGPYTIGVDRFMVGPVTKYLPIDPDSLGPSDAPLGSPIADDGVDSVAERGESAVQRWDAAVVESDKMYAQQMHNICCNNCHHHSATALANAGLPTTMFGAWLMITLRGRWVSTSAWLSTNLPFLLIVAACIFFSLYKIK